MCFLPGANRVYLDCSQVGVYFDCSQVGVYLDCSQVGAYLDWSHESVHILLGVEDGGGRAGLLLEPGNYRLSSPSTYRIQNKTNS